ncbi:unnamed protein product, partial [Ectocarpus sp. 13 AM-2016]
SSHFLSSLTRCWRTLEIVLIFLSGLSALSDTSSASECLDSNDADGCQISADGSLNLGFCGITDADLDDLTTCLEAAGPETITTLFLNDNEITALPEGIFGDLTALESLILSSNDLTTLPEGIFQNATALDYLSLHSNELTTLPEGIFGSLTALESLWMYNNDLTTLPEGIFQGLTALEYIGNHANLVVPSATLDPLLHLPFASCLPPANLFRGLNIRNLNGNSLDCLPSTSLMEVDDNASVYEDGLHVDAYGDECGCSIEGVMDNVCGGETCTPGDEGYTCGATISPVPAPSSGTATPESAPQPTPVPGSSSEVVVSYAEQSREREISPPISDRSAPIFSFSAVEIARHCVLVRGDSPPSGSQRQALKYFGLIRRKAFVLLPAVACWSPASINTHRCYSTARLDKEGASTVVVVVGVVAGVLALAALGFFLRRRRAAKSLDPEPSTPPPHGGGSLEHGRGETHQQRPQDIHSSSAIIVGFAAGNLARGWAPPTQQDSPPPPAPYAHDGAHQRDALPPPSPHRHDGGTDHRDAWPPLACQQHAFIAAETKLGGDGTPIQSLFPAPSVGSLPKHSSERNLKRTRDKNESGGGTRAPNAVRGRGRGDAAEDSGGFVAEAEQSLPSLMTTNSTAGVSTADRTAEVAGFGFSTEEGDDGAPSAGAPAPAPAGGRRQMSSGVGYGQAVLAAAEELAHHCQIPGVSEAATAVSILIHLVLDSRDLTSRGEAAVKRCRSIVTMLERAAKVLGKGGDTSTEEERVLVEEVHDAVSDLVELIKTYQNKSKLAQVLTSTLFKRRQDELNAVLDRAIWSVHLGLQVQVGHNVAQVGHDVGQVRHDVAHLVKRATGEAQAESLVEARRSRRQHRLDQIEIPEDQLSITNEMLGKGGFGVVYLADYNGHNAAAKVQHITHGLGKPGENDAPLCGPKSVESDVLREKAERRAFLRELDAMIRLRNPHTVNVYGAITSLPDRLVLVMELLAGGDLRAMRRCMATSSPQMFFWMAAEGQRHTSVARGGLKIPRDLQALPPTPRIRDQALTSAMHGLPQRRCWSRRNPPRRATSTASGWWRGRC